MRKEIIIGMLIFFILFVFFGPLKISLQKGKSMCPEMGEYSISIINKYFNDYEKGDVVTYKRGENFKVYNIMCKKSGVGECIGHKIKGYCDDGSYFIEGVHPYATSECVNESQIIGKNILNIDLRGCENG